MDQVDIIFNSSDRPKDKAAAVPTTLARLPAMGICHCATCGGLNGAAVSRKKSATSPQGLVAFGP